MWLSRLTTIGRARLAGKCSLAAAAAAVSASAVCAHAAAAAEPEPPKPAASSSFGLPSAVTQPFDFVYEKVYENVIAPYAEPSRDKLLPDIPPQLKGREKPTLVVSLDGTLIQSQWTRQFGWRYIKRPGVDEFLAQLAPLYELVLWTECLSTAEVAVDRLDPRRCFRHRLYRDATTYSSGMHRKDLSALNRDLDKVLIIDCDSQAFSMQPGAHSRGRHRARPRLSLSPFASLLLPLSRAHARCTHTHPTPFRGSQRHRSK